MNDDWQPARLRFVHKRPADADPRDWWSSATKIVRVRQSAIKSSERYRELGCDATQFFDVHPKDCGCQEAIICEHEILTD
jgi:hypothetical protein